MIVNDSNWENKKVLVTGASGFKGSWLCATLNALGAKVFGTTRDQIHPDSAFTAMRLETYITKVTGDITNRQQVYDMINSVEPDVIFHLAAKALVPVSLRDPRRTFDVNIMGTLNIIEACRKLEVCDKILICSTDHVFGYIEPKDLPAGGFPENARVSYGGPYDTSKAAMELLVRSYHATYWSEVPAIGITRCANVFGYGDVNQRRIIPLFVSKAVNGDPIPLKYRKNGRQFIHITDAIAGYIRAASTLDEPVNKNEVGGEKPNRSPFTPTFHFAIESYEGTEEPYIRMQALSSFVCKLFSVDVDDSVAVDYAKNENKVQALNCSKTRSDINWSIRKPFNDAIIDLSKWYRQGEDINSHQAEINKDVEYILDGLD